MHQQIIYLILIIQVSLVIKGVETISCIVNVTALCSSSAAL